MKDAEVIERIRRGDEKALDYLYKKNYRMMVKLVRNNQGTEDEAKDIFQEALIVFWQKIVSDQLTLTSKISTYLYSICKNLWNKELDKKARHTNEVVDGEDFQNHDSKERIRLINECIDSLGDTCKKMLTYYYFDGLNMDKIAEMLGFANADTAKSKKYKCKKKLDQLIKEKYTESDFLD